MPGGPADVVIRHAQAQGRNAQHIEDAAQRVLADAVGVPLRQQHHRAMALRRKPARVDAIVLGIRRRYRRGEAQKLAPLVFELLLGRLAAGVKEFDLAMLDAEIVRRGVAEELVAVLDQVIVDVGHVPQHRVLVVLILRNREALDARPARGPVQAPLERAHHAIVVARGHARFPVVNPAAVMVLHLLRWYSSRGIGMQRKPSNPAPSALNGGISV